MSDDREYSGDDIYCDLILSRKISVEIAMETDQVLAFHHTHPHWPTHVVVVPKQHIASFLELDLDGDVAHELLHSLQNVSKTVMKSTTGTRIVTNLGAYQDSKHLHFHVYSEDRV